MVWVFPTSDADRARLGPSFRGTSSFVHAPDTSPGDTLFCLHYLGGSAREWAPLAERLGDQWSVVALDLPGFGDAARASGYTVDEMAGTIARTIAAEAPRRWMLVGHSMGAKIAAVIARRAEDGARELGGLIGLVLVAGSPPGPEPMDEPTRREMLGRLCGDGAARLDDARRYIEKNGGPQLTAERAEGAVDDVLRANPAAWQAWLASGSREDWSERVGIIQTPTLVVAGADDANLGPSAQRRLTAPHFAHVRSATLPNAKHLLPLECPDDLARLIEEHRLEHVPTATRGVAHAGEAHDAYDALIASDRVSRATRRALLDRARPDERAYVPVAFDSDSLSTLRAVVDRVIPQDDADRIDLAARIDRELASGVGDGWRFATLPPDAQAYTRGLFSLNAAANAAYGRDFTALDPERQDAFLQRVASGECVPVTDLASEAKYLDAGAMRAWFEDVRADAVKLFVAHPRQLARMGYSGIANGGDGSPKSGFVRVGLDEREPWEPLASADRTS